jgi:hypothetical protein
MGAVSYHCMADHLQSSLLALAAREYNTTKNIRIVCDTVANPTDVLAMQQARERLRALLDSVVGAPASGRNF